MRQVINFVSVLLLLSFLFSSRHSSENDIFPLHPEVTLDDIKEGMLLIESETGGYYNIIPNLHTNVHIDVSGMVLSATVDQVFTNDSTEPIEAVYVFPLPPNAAVNNMTMIINDRIIQGTVKEKVKAKEVYKKARSEGKRASLTVQERPNIFTNSISNIMPGDTIIVRINYINEVQYKKGVFSLRHPMVVAPRYITGNAVTGYSGQGWAFDTDMVPDASRITPPVVKPGERSKNFISLSVNLDVGLDIERIESPSHNIKINKKIEGLYDIELDKKNNIPNKDFVLEYTIKKGKEPKAALFVNSINDENYFMLMAMPPNENFNQEINIPKDMIFVIDVSGSMSGVSIQQAKSSLIYAINNLKETDGFNVIPFSSNFISLNSKIMPATPENKQSAIAYIKTLRADGGTEALPPLKFAMNMPSYDNKLKMIIFITDGSLGHEQDVINLVKNNLGNSRFFSIGIGSAPNSYLLEKVSREGRGTFTYISNQAQVSSKVEELFKKIEMPVLTNIDFKLNGKGELYPNPIPDLFLDEPLIIFGKVDILTQLSAEFSGENASGYFKINLPINLNKSQSNSSIGAIWARKKIAAYMDEWHLGDKSVEQKILDIALSHNLVSKFTSFVAVEHKIVNSSDIAQIVPLPVDLPEGWEYHKVFGGLPQIVDKSLPQKMKSLPQTMKPKNQKINTKSQTLSKPIKTSHIRSTRTSLPGTATNMPIYFVFGIVVIFISLIILIRQQIAHIKKD